MGPQMVENNKPQPGFSPNTGDKVTEPITSPETFYSKAPRIIEKPKSCHPRWTEVRITILPSRITEKKYVAAVVII